MTALRRAIPALALLIATAAAAPLPAQESTEQALARQVFPPEVVMKNAQRIALSGAQREEMTRAIQRAQARTVELQWKLQEEVDRLIQLLQATKPDEVAVLAQMDKVLTLERDVKREHMLLLVRIKGTLTREQQETLRSLL